MSDTVLLGVTLVVNSGLGLVILLRNYRSSINRYFFVFTISIILWSLSNYLADHAGTNNLWYTRLTFVFGLGMAQSIFYTGNIITGRPVFRRRWVTVLEGTTLITSYLSLSPWVVPRIIKIENGVQLDEGPLLLPLTLVGTTIVVLGLVAYYRSYRIANPTQRNQIRLLATGITVYITAALSVNLIVPQFVGSWKSSHFGPSFTVVFVAFTAYTITRHRLFDIRLALIRSVAYVLTILTLSGVLLITLVIIANPFIEEQLTRELQFFYSIILSLIAGMAFRPLRRFFNKLTRRVFYRQTYIPSTLINRFSAALVGTTSFEDLGGSGLRTLHKALRPIQTQLIVVEGGERLFSGVIGVSPGTTDIKTLTKLSNNITVADEMINRLRAAKLYNQQIAVVSKLYSQNLLLGFLIFGPKQSGGIYTKDDIDLIATCSSNLAVAIDNAKKYEQIEAFNVELQKEIEKATAALRLSNHGLRELHRAKDDFISAASHQLKPQLSVAHGLISMLQDPSIDTKRERGLLLKNAERSIERMSLIVSGILDKSVQDAEQASLGVSEFDLVDMVKDEVELAAADAKRKDIHLAFETNKPSIPVKLDRLKIREAISNIMHNAVEYTRPGGQISILLSNNTDQAVFTVKDTGIGIPKTEIPRIGEKFFRASNSSIMRPTGTGIGMYVTRSYVEAHQGHMTIESVKGKGSIIGFQIPRQPSPGE